MNIIYQKLQGEINQLKLNGNYRDFTQIDVVDFPQAKLPTSDKVVTIWSTTDYLGLGHNSMTKTSISKAVEQYGTGTVGSRNIGGSSSLHIKLEETMAEIHNKEAALLFSTGYGANDGTLSCLAQLIGDCVFISDEKNHASIINGLRQRAGCIKKIFKHNDLCHLEQILQTIDYETPKLIIFESVYSMDGSVAKIEEIIKLAKQYNALTYLDEVHAVGVYGAGGAGYANELGLDGQIDIIQGTFAKSYGVVGGYITGSRVLIDAVRSFCSNFIFTTSMPPMLVSIILANVNYLKSSNKERILLQQNVNNLRQNLLKHKLPLMLESASHILPIFVGEINRSKQIAAYLLNNYNIYVQAINYPSVEKGTERLRISITPLHSQDDINHLIYGLVDAFAKIGLNGSN
ncbi:MAG: 5-aminolevulinate synthase [Burkholderiales bacterium]|nr:5-aminolevulinate synthase [Burkholderiales bacterium]